ncbi:MAG: hypothetical protein JWM05_341 [Acidimicrobiales bacterium]|nr:hypothetical protein [Acidimicrobiales bacterium]
MSSLSSLAPVPVTTAPHRVPGARRRESEPTTRAPHALPA